jgi:hypothetical protein
MAPGGCVVEEEIPPSWLKNWTAWNVPSTEFDATTTQHEATVVSTKQVSLNPHCFSKDHLQLIFEMRRNLEDQLYNQSILSRRMDLMFDSLSSAPTQQRCPTCSELFVFTYSHDGGSGSSHL